MPRVRLFDKEKALKNAMELFWKKGFNGTSTRDLVKATGLATSSIYNTFGSKESLFFETLRHYQEAEHRKINESLIGSASGLNAIRGVFECMVQKEGTVEINVMGCFMINSITELAIHHPQLSQFAANARTIEIALLRELLQRAQQQCEIPAGKDLNQLAVYLHTIINGLKVSGVLAKDPKELKSIIDVTIQSLKNNVI